MKNLIYISNTRIPSEKANTYQSMVMCEAFSNYFDKVEFWYPRRNNKEEMKKIKDVYGFYNVKKVFDLKEIFSLDLKFLYNWNQKSWFLIQNISFALNYIFKLNRLRNKAIIFSRDIIGIRLLSIAKRIGFVKHKIFFEAHVYSPEIAEIVKYIDGIVVINNYLKNLYEKDGVKNILVAHDGVNLDEYSSISEYKFTPNKKEYNIVYTGNLFKWKGVHTLVDSLEYLNNNIKLFIVGGSEEIFENFENYCNNKKYKDRIILTGFIPKKNTIDYIKKADVLILPNSANDKMSFYTSPLKLFEYMASKRPIVASKLPSIEEILGDKKNAVLCEPDNPKDLAYKIKWCLENDTSNIVEQAYKDVQEYTWDKRAEKIVRWMV